MRWSEIITESVIKVTIDHGFEKPFEIPVFRNPSKIQLENLFRRKGEARFILDDDGSLYVWSSGDATHSEVREGLGLEYLCYGLMDEDDGEKNIGVLIPQDVKYLTPIIKNNSNIIACFGPAPTIYESDDA